MYSHLETVILDVDGDLSEWSNVQLYSDFEIDGQLFQIVQFDDASFLIVSASCGLVVSPESSDAGSGVNVCLREYNGSDYQAWVLEPANEESFYIINKTSGMYLDVDNAKAANLTNIKLYGYRLNSAKHKM